MKYNPRATLNQDQVEFKRNRASGHTFADRFSRMNGESRSESAAANYYKNAMKKRMQRRGDWYG